MTGREQAKHPISSLPARGKQPATKKALHLWIRDASEKTGVPQRRLNTLVANSVVLAILQTSKDTKGPRFLLKGGTGIEIRLALKARASADLDTMFRGEFKDWLGHLDQVLSNPFPPFTFKRDEPEEIPIQTRVVKPYRVKIKLELNGSVALATKLEVAPDEAGAGDSMELLTLPNLEHLGINLVENIAVLILDYQVAQKIHAVTDPHNPPNSRNDRAHDLIDLLLIRNAFYSQSSQDQLRGLKTAAVKLFEARATEANKLGLQPRTWPH